MSILAQNSRVANLVSRDRTPQRFLSQIFLVIPLILLTVTCQRDSTQSEGGSISAAPAPAVEPQGVTIPPRVVNYGFEVIKVYPHDPGAFTQGLLYHNGYLYESTGLNGQSSLRQVDLATGEVRRRVDLADTYFAEGLALHNRKLYQLTWQSSLGFIYDLDSFQLLRTFNYRGEGWGLTVGGGLLILSDGSSRLRFIDPETLDLRREVDVLEGERPVNQLNELEFVNGAIWANIWQSDRLVQINPETGKVMGWVNLGGLLPAEDRQRGVDVLNGIAWDEDGPRLFVTGKLWPKLFEIRLIERATRPTR
ncbi:MAG: glutaminyl-peptide cyclotransferase [Acidobacteria bacterium]|nr:glutaminyl-peptide cyclotransferase [Acidobacteriota bacterium]